MKFPFILRSEHEAKIKEFEDRLFDLERHFVTRRDETGKILETLADRRKRGAQPPKRVKWQQMRAWLENTDGGRHVPEKASGIPKGA